MTADTLLSRLSKVKPTGSANWTACCPAHDDRTPSLSVRVTEDGRVLVHCFGGCSVEEVLSAVSMTFGDLFPPRPPRPEGHKPIRKPFLPTDVFDIVLREATVVFLIACDLHKKKTVAEQDYERLLTAVGKLEDISGAAYGR